MNINEIEIYLMVIIIQILILSLIGFLYRRQTQLHQKFEGIKEELAFINRNYNYLYQRVLNADDVSGDDLSNNLHEFKLLLDKINSQQTHHIEKISEFVKRHKDSWYWKD